MSEHWLRSLMDDSGSDASISSLLSVFYWNFILRSSANSCNVFIKKKLTWRQIGIELEKYLWQNLSEQFRSLVTSQTMPKRQDIKTIEWKQCAVELTQRILNFGNISTLFDIRPTANDNKRSRDWLALAKVIEKGRTDNSCGSNNLWKCHFLSSVSCRL